MASVPDEIIFPGQDQLSQKKPNQFMQRIKSKSELHRQKQFSSAQKAMQQERERIGQNKATRGKVSGFNAQVIRQTEQVKKNGDPIEIEKSQDLQNPYLMQQLKSESEIDALKAKKQQFSLIEAMKSLQFTKA